MAEQIVMVRLTEWLRESGYEVGGAEYRRIIRAFADGRYPVYQPSPRVKWITVEVAAQILDEIPPAQTEPEPEAAELRDALAALQAAEERVKALVGGTS